MNIAKHYGGGYCPPASKSLLRKRFSVTPRSTSECAALIGIYILSICALCLCTSSCKTISNVVESGGILLETASKSIMTIEKIKLEKSHPAGAAGSGVLLRRFQNNKAYLEIKLDAMPFITLYANEPDSSGMFEFTQLKYLAGNYSGWNEFYMNINGTATLITNRSGSGKEKTGTLIIEKSPGAGTITQAAIRRNSSRLYSQRALDGIIARQARVESIVQWMKKDKNVTHFESFEDFQNYWTRVLLPETLKRSERSDQYNQIQSNTPANQYVTAEEIKWNTAYTKIIFEGNEELFPVRDSGALLRDLEEATPWFYLYYCWDDLFSPLGNTAH